jgi:hypothetical protein
MPNPKSDPLVSRGVWCLIVGVFTSWLLGLGLLFILAAAVCGFVGLFRQRALQSFALLVASIVLCVFCAHIAAVSGIYAYNAFRSTRSSESAPVTVSPATHRK